MSKYIFLLLLTVSFNLSGAADSLVNPGIRFGFDLTGFIRNYSEPGLMTWEASAGMEVWPNWYAAIEGGITTIDIEKTSHNYHANGFFFRGGIDYNFLSNSSIKDAGIVYGLARYGFGWIRQEAPRVVITNPYWGDIETGVPAESASAHWLEAGAGVVSKLFWKIHIGWSVRVRFLLFQTDTPVMEPYYFSGFGKNNGKQPVMINYSIYYKL